jgi:hypothetical protein
VTRDHGDPCSAMRGPARDTAISTGGGGRGCLSGRVFRPLPFRPGGRVPTSFPTPDRQRAKEIAARNSAAASALARSSGSS